MILQSLKENSGLLVLGAAATLAIVYFGIILAPDPTTDYDTYSWECVEWYDTKNFQKNTLETLKMVGEEKHENIRMDLGYPGDNVTILVENISNDGDIIDFVVTNSSQDWPDVDLSTDRGARITLSNCTEYVRIRYPYGDEDW